MCHAPIVVPAVGGREAHNCLRTTRGMREVAQRVVAARPDRLVLVSPHSPRMHGVWRAWEGPRHRGDLGRFRAPEIAVDLPDAPEVRQHLGLAGIPTAPLDHGAMVPLAFLWEAGWRGPTSILAQPWEETGAACIGQRIAELDGRTAVVASGDMSHRLKPGAPAGFHRDASAFDRGFVEALRRRAWDGLEVLPHREVAAEDVVTSTVMAAASVPAPLHDEVLSYEGPWGVGYTEAILYDPEPPLYAVARLTLAAHIEGRKPSLGRSREPPAGVFVTLRKNGELRGCIGHTEPTRDDLFAEVAELAVAAATRDPRFPPVATEELPDIRFEVSVMARPQDVASTDGLDPRVDGIIVAARGRRGLLLPGIDGVDSVAQQEVICRKKAGIHDDEQVSYQTFTVRSVEQPW